MIAITYALPSESRPLMRRLRHQRKSSLPHTTLGSIGLHESAVIHTGMGMERTRQRLAAALDHPAAEAPRLLISAGYAGALAPHIKEGTLFLASNASSEEPLQIAQEFLGMLGCTVETGRLATSSQMLESPEEKAVLASKTGAHVVDMETEVIASLCRARGVPMLSIRVISDNATDPLPVPFSVCINEETGQARPLSIALHLMQHPWRISGFLQFAKQATRSGEELARAISLLLPVLNPL